MIDKRKEGRQRTIMIAEDSIKMILVEFLGKQLSLLGFVQKSCHHKVQNKVEEEISFSY